MWLEEQGQRRGRGWRREGWRGCEWWAAGLVLGVLVERTALGRLSSMGLCPMGLCRGAVHTVVAGTLSVPSSNQSTAPPSVSHLHLILSFQPPSPSRAPYCSPQRGPCSLGILTPRPILGQSG